MPLTVCLFASCCSLVVCVIQREPELEFGAIYRAKIVEIRQVLFWPIFPDIPYCASDCKLYMYSVS